MRKSGVNFFCIFNFLSCNCSDIGEMNMTVYTSSGEELLTASDNTTVESTIQLLAADLSYVTCEMITPYPMVNMTPVVSKLPCVNSSSTHAWYQVGIGHVNIEAVFLFTENS